MPENPKTPHKELMGARPYFSLSNGELSRIAQEHQRDNAVLADVLSELQYRKTPKAALLRRQVTRLLQMNSGPGPVHDRAGEPTGPPEAAPVPHPAPPSGSAGRDESRGVTGGGTGAGTKSPGPLSPHELPGEWNRRGSTENPAPKASVNSDEAGSAKAPSPTPEPPARETTPARAREFSPELRKARQVFRYLKELHEVRTPVQRDIADAAWTLDLTHLPLHDHCAVRSDLAAILLREPTLDDTSDAILSVRRPRLTQAPEPPAHLLAWVEGRWKDPRAELTHKRFITTDTVRTVQFEDEPGLAADWHAYVALRNAWRDMEVPVREVADVFDRLFALHARLERESERFELVLADGMLSWAVASGGLHYPILHQPVDLQFEPTLPQFTLQVSDRPAVFHSALFRGVEEAPASATSEAKTSVEEEGISSLDLGTAEKLFRELVGKLHSHGWYGEDDTGALDRAAPHIERSPVLLLKDRAQGYGAFIERLLEVTDDEAVQPAKPLLPVLGHHAAVPGEGPGPVLDSTEVLLSKPANQEQIEVVQDLARSDGVVVQGPPGTGKSHTIANLVGHLLAHGKSVLVTSYASKALRVLREHIVEPLRPLTVSVVTDDAASQAELALSIQRIAERLGSDSAGALDRRAERLRRDRNALLQKVDDTRDALLAAREAEYRPIAVAGRSYGPSEAARIVHEGRDPDGWIPAGVVRGAPLPLSAEEVADLYATNDALSTDDEAELAAGPPKPADVLDPQAFADFATQVGRPLGNAWLRYWERPPAAEAFGETEALAHQFGELAGTLEALTEWERRIFAAALRGGGDARLWDEFADDAERMIDAIREALVAVRRYGPEIPSTAEPGPTIEVAEELAARVARGGGMGRVALLFRPTWRAFLDAVRVDGRLPATPEEFRSVARAVELDRLRTKLRSRWERLVEGVASPDVSADQPEVAMEQLIVRIRELLDGPRALIEPALAALTAAGFRYSNGAGGRVFAGEAAELDRLLDDLHSVQIPAVLERRDHCLRLRYQGKLDSLRDSLADASSPVGAGMRRAILAVDPEAYAESYAQVVRLARLEPVFVRRRDLLARLRAAANTWARAIERREGVHGQSEPPGEPERAWVWRQLEDEIVARDQADIEGLQETLTRTQDEIRDKTAHLVENLAWAAQIRRTTGQARQDLLGYQQLLKKIGKGTGKRAPKLRIEAQKKLKSCREAVPVWIMPLARVVESFDPADTRFDVVIIDEASQMDVMGLLAFHLADRVLVVGDDEQVSPSAIGQKLDIVDQLIAEHLAGIPNAELYDGQTSIYDLAGMSFGSSRMLKEHFRCVPEIIAYSNDLSYHGDILPLRDGSESPRKPATVAYRVRGGRENAANVNAREAEETAALVAAALDQPEYEDASFGVISLLGNSHDARVDEHLRQRLRTDQYAKHRILCGSPPQFQGDERDVIILNMVKGPGGEGPLHLQSPGNKVWKQRYNVAASRAKDQLWVVHSVDPGVDLQQDDIRTGLLRHVRDPQATERRISRVEHRTESVFEREVAADLLRAGYTVTPQYPVGNYRIDLVVKRGVNKVAVECDGDRFHTAENLQEDLQRQAVLERLGWRFIRIRGTRFFRDRERTMAQVMERLNRLGVLPNMGTDAGDRDPDLPTELYMRVTRRAAELLREWQSEDAMEDAGLD